MKNILIALLVLMVMPATGMLQAQTAPKYVKMAEEILKLVNDHRKGMGLSPMTMNAAISQGAIVHSTDMAAKKIPFGHDGFDKRMASIGKQLKNPMGWAENVAEGATDAQEVVTMWLNSPTHKKNMEGDYDLTGIGIAAAKDGSLYFTQIFFNATAR